MRDIRTSGLMSGERKRAAASRPLYRAVPRLYWSLVALIGCMRLSLRKGAHVDLFGVAY
jgi:hypothetical protein